MKNIKSFRPDKYDADVFEEVEEGIFFAADEYSTCLSFEQEPEFGEGDSPTEISQYPLEDILDKFRVYVSDFFEELNESSESVCYQEFCSPDIEDIRSLRTIIGKHVYDNNGVLAIEG